MQEKMNSFRFSVLVLIVVLSQVACKKTSTEALQLNPIDENLTFRISVPNGFSIYGSKMDRVILTKEDKSILQSIEVYEDTEYSLDKFNGLVSEWSSDFPNSITVETISRSDSIAHFRCHNGIAVNEDLVCIFKIKNGRGYYCRFMSIEKNVCEAIANSIQPKTSNNATNAYSNFSDNYFSIEYPSEWVYDDKTNPSEVFLGAADGEISCSIFHTVTDMVIFNEIIEVLDENIANNGMKLLSKEITKINERDCCVEDIEMSFQDTTIQQKKFIFFKSPLVYCVTFGNNADMMKKHQKEIDHVIQSFKIKFN